MWRGIKTRLKRLSLERQIAAELSGYSDRSLQDIGIRRVDIRRFAQRAATET